MSTPSDGAQPSTITGTPGALSSSSAFFTDRYELTMVQAALAHGSAERRSVFEVFTRRLPAGRRYGVIAGTARVLEAIADFRFGDAELQYLRDNNIVNQQTLDYLADYRFTGTINGYAEGEVFFPGSPVLTIEGTFAEAVLLETVVLSILNYDSAVASAASRMTSAAGSRPCLEMGARRAQEEAAVAAARAAVIAGFAGTSNLEAGRRYGLSTIGTAAHSFTLLHHSEAEAFDAQIAAYGTSTTLLVDTYDIPTGVRRAIEAAGTELDAIRLDSGDLGVVAREVREQLDSLGAPGTKIVVSSDLDEYAIASLAIAPVDSYGVGTSVVTGSGAPTCSMVYKLVAREGADGSMESVAKKATSKSSIGGRKSAGRRLDAAHRATEEVVYCNAPAQWRDDAEDVRHLHVPLVDGGEINTDYTGVGGLERAIERHRRSRAELAPGARRLSAGDPAISTTHLLVD